MTQPPDTSRSAPAATFVVYDLRSGEILLTHHLSIAPGAALPEEHELERFILEHAAQATARDAGHIGCTKAAAGDLQPRTTYRVDLGSKRLVASARDGSVDWPRDARP